ncbi:phosphotransferase enzyme family protein [Histoplasma capsulatum]|uniref:Altered inheritance of mitochondria protein 9, mitochondrial n=1 Tax=Ajellomyces capsulatus TaxID=5037 RepID=A0A8A1LXC6_AJECA|nr:phosphotransferase enzyme family protein [Histoplasma capsulatum]
MPNPLETLSSQYGQCAGQKPPTLAAEALCAVRQSVIGSLGPTVPSSRLAASKVAQPRLLHVPALIIRRPGVFHYLLNSTREFRIILLIYVFSFTYNYFRSGWLSKYVWSDQGVPEDLILLHVGPLVLSRCYVKFNVEGLCRTASDIVGAPCTQVTKLPEGLYNKVFSLKTDTGEELFARIPHPNARSARELIASEVATLDFLRNVLGIPVPEVVAWSSPSFPNLVGTEDILMKRIIGHQLSDVWNDMSQAPGEEPGCH